MTPPAGESTPASGPEPGPGPDPVEDIVALYLERMESGEEPKLDELCRETPDLLPAVRARVSALIHLGFGPRPASNPDADSFPTHLGEFHLLSRLGGGGMGVVYLAEQEKLGRRVALKLIRPEHLYFPGARERFRREVETVAQLKHPGIVPIYTVGEENGIPYFAMEWVEGASLADVVGSLANHRNPKDLDGGDFARAVSRGGANPNETNPKETTPTNPPPPLFSGSWSEVCLRIARQVAVALDHAHSQGVLHRDVKPSNVMVTPDGRILLLDFGLAHREGADKLTRSRAQLGSLYYMSPEQVLGNTNEIDVRSDIYSLGVTLYEMLTLRVPFPSDSTAEVSRQILDGRWTPIRELNPTIPRDAQIVVATAMDRDAPRRYRSAAAFARDLGNLLELRPIEARPQTPWVHARRWAQRHPAASVAIVLGSLLVIGGPTAFAVVQNIERAKTTIALEDSEKNLDFALRAVDRLVGGLGEDLSDEPRMEEVRRKYLVLALQFYNDLRARYESHPEARLRTATALARVADIQQKLGESTAAKASIEEAISMGRGLAAERPDDSRAAAGLATALDQLGAVQNSLGRPDLAEANFRESLAAREALVGRNPKDPELLLAEAYSRDHLGVALRKLGRLADARAAHDRALEILAGLAKRAPKDPEIQRAIARAEYNLAECWRFEANYDNLAKAASRALAAIDALRALGPLSPGDREDEAMIRGALGLAYISAGKLDSALDEDRKSLEIRKSLAADFPRTLRLRLDLAKAYHNSGLFLVRLQRTDDAVEAIRESKRLYAALAAEFPTVLAPQFGAVAATKELGTCLKDTGLIPAAKEQFDEATTRLDAMDATFPGNLEVLEMRGRVCIELADMLEMVEDCSGSERELRRAIDSFESMGERKSLDASVAVLLANAYDNLGVHLAEHSRGSEGLEYHIKAVATLEPKLATATTERALYYGLRYNLGAAYFDCGNPKEAEPHLAAALDGLLAELARKPKDAMLVKEMIDSASLLARTRLALGEPERAKSAVDVAVAALSKRKTLPKKLRDAVELVEAAASRPAAETGK